MIDVQIILQYASLLSNSVLLYSYVPIGRKYFAPVLHSSDNKYLTVGLKNASRRVICFEVHVAAACFCMRSYPLAVNILDLFTIGQEMICMAVVFQKCCCTAIQSTMHIKCPYFELTLSNVEVYVLVAAFLTAEFWRMYVVILDEGCGRLR
jgi:hypothetical protein